MTTTCRTQPRATPPLRVQHCGCWIGGPVHRFYLGFSLALIAALPFQDAHGSEPLRHGKAIKSFRRYAEARIEKDPIPGMTVGFMFGTSVWADGFGYADLENNVSAKDVSAYRLASVTKPMTAMGILYLMEQGELDLDAEVQTYVPYFPRKAWPVRVRALLGHLGGISHYRNYDLEGHFKDHKDTRQALEVFADFDLVAEPGTRFNYSSYGYNLLGAVIEGAAGEPYGEFMRRILWEPLGMSDTRMDDPYAIIPNRVRGYRAGPDGEIIPSEFVDISSRFAAGGTRSTVVDLLRFAEGLRDGKILSPETVDLMWTSMVTSDERETRYGMGWNVRPINGRFVVFHTGGQAETRTIFIYVPSKQLAIAAAMNFEGGGRDAYVRRLYQALMDEGFNTEPYATREQDQQLVDVMQAVFTSGVPHYDRTGQPLATHEDELDAAFDYLKEVFADVHSGAYGKATEERVEAGMHPVSGLPLRIAGSYMAAVVDEARNGLDEVQASGGVELFATYMDAYGRSDEVPQTRRLTPETENMVRALHADWKRTWDRDTRQAAWPTYQELDAIEPLLNKLTRRFDAARIYPDFSSPLSEFVSQRVIQEDVSSAVRVAQWGVRWYPREPRAHVDAALAHAAAADLDAARSHASQAHALDPDGVASAGGLNRRAYGLRAAGGLEPGLTLLRLARDLHPENANLCDSIAEFHLAAGRRDEAIEWYEKALEVDPDFENARTVLEKLRSESAVSER